MKNNIQTYAKLIRINQWYKNLLIFLPLSFAAEQTHSWPLLILGFFGFCSISSITYMINDWIDRKEDRLHPVKKHRPLASGEISKNQAILTGLLLSVFITVVSWNLGLFYSGIVGTYFLLTNAYSFGLKHIPLVDLLLITTNFILRTLAGLMVFPKLETFPYFILVFGTLMMFITHKRIADNRLLGKKASHHKPVLAFYTKKKTKILLAMSWMIQGWAFYKIGIQSNEWLKWSIVFLILLNTSRLFLKKNKLVTTPNLLFKETQWSIPFFIGLVIIIFS
jgi:4-hydroxybenzoate polyprenyltransferase